MVSRVVFTALCLFFLGISAFSQETFSGPLGGWANIKTRFGAKGDGKTDDTKSIQKAIDQLANPESGANMGSDAYVVIYFPAGTYLISKTLLCRGKIGFTIVGEDPSKTIIKWIGADNDTMLVANGSAYFKIHRFTWMANGHKNIEGIGVHWLERWNDGKTRSYASLNIELSDMVFSGGFSVGIGGGTFQGPNGTGSNDSELTIMRCTFSKCTDAGIKIGGYNALDYWIWSSKFEGCKFGVYCASGNYHIYSSLFKNSTESDIQNKGGYYTSVRDCYSVGSKAFSKDEGASCNPFKRIFQSNIVLNCYETPIQYYHLGNVTSIDNYYSTSVNKKIMASISLSSWCPGFYNVLSLGDQYSYTSPIDLPRERKKIYRQDLKVATRPNLDVKYFEGKMQKTPKLFKGTVFEIPKNASEESIKAIIGKAELLKGKRTLIHFPMGKYYLSNSLELPPNSDMQITGDGLLYSTQLLFKDEKKAGAKPIVIINGPSNVSISNLQLGLNSQTGNQSSGIELRNVDQPGSRLLVDQLYSSAESSMDLQSMNYLYVEKNNTYFSEGNSFSGGKIQQSGKGTFKVIANGGQFSRVSLVKNAVFVAKDCWWEGIEKSPVDLEGDGRLTLDGCMIAPRKGDSSSSFTIKKFRGKVALLNMYIQGGLAVEPNNKGLDLIGWNLHFYYKMNPFETVEGSHDFNYLLSGITSQCFDSKNKNCEYVTSFEPRKSSNIDEIKYFETMLSDLRKNRPSFYITKNTSGSNVNISRVSIGFLKKGIKSSGE